MEGRGDGWSEEEGSRSEVKKAYVAGKAQANLVPCSWCRSVRNVVVNRNTWQQKYEITPGVG